MGVFEEPREKDKCQEARDWQCYPRCPTYRKVNSGNHNITGVSPRPKRDCFRNGPFWETWKSKVCFADIEDHRVYEGLPGVLGLFPGIGLLGGRVSTPFFAPRF